MIHLVDKSRTALITGITGQDGSFLAEFLLEKGYRVFGMITSASEAESWPIKQLEGRIELILGDLVDQDSLIEAVEQSRPREVYNLAAQSFVPSRVDVPHLRVYPHWAALRGRDCDR